MAQSLQQFSWPIGTYYFEQPWVIDDVTFLVTARWNSRSLLYFLDFADATDVSLVTGLPMRTGRNLIAPYKTQGLPAGKIFVYDTTGKEADAGLSDPGVTHFLCYVSAA